MRVFRTLAIRKAPTRRSLLGDRRGVIAVETALTFSLFFLPLFLGGADVAVLMGTQLQLQAAVRNEIFYAYSSSSNATNTAGIEAAATVAYGTGGPTLSVATPTYAYYCIAPNGTEATGAAESSSSVTCPNGETLATWLTVSVSATASLPVSIAPFSATMPLSASATVRVN